MCFHVGHGMEVWDSADLIPTQHKILSRSTAHSTDHRLVFSTFLSKARNGCPRYQVPFAPATTGGGKLFRDLTNPIQNLLWLVKIYHPHLAQFRDNTNFTISDLQNNTTTPNLTNNWHLSKFWVLHSILDVSKGENKKDKFERQQNLDPQPPIKILLPLIFILFVFPFGDI